MTLEADKIPLALIVAKALNGVIGHQNRLPWFLPEELQSFKRITLGKPIIMGRVTFESIGRPLPGRTNIVVTRNPQDHAHWSGIRLASNLETAIHWAKSQALIDGAAEILVIGGEQLYRAALPKAQRLYLTTVEATPEGDAFFPEMDTSSWKCVSEVRHPAQEGNRYAYRLSVLERL